MAWTGLTATALWYAVGRHGKHHSIATLIGVFATVVTLHAPWDSVTNLVGHVTLAAASLTLIGVVMHVAAGRPLAKYDRPTAPNPPHNACDLELHTPAVKGLRHHRNPGKANDGARRRPYKRLTDPAAAGPGVTAGKGGPPSPGARWTRPLARVDVPGGRDEDQPVQTQAG